jgi:hypothetical protein
MKVYSKSSETGKTEVSSIPNLIAYSYIKKFLTDDEFEEIREGYFLPELNQSQVNFIMKEVKLLFKNYKDLIPVTIENKDGDIVQFML